jgi:hypothetical protein
MFAVVGNVIACVCWGTIISITICALVYVIVKLFYPTYSFSITSGILLSSLAIFLFIQSFLLMGANYVKDYTEEIANVVLTVVSDTEDTVRLMALDVQNSVDAALNTVDGQVDIAKIKDALVSEYPVFGKYIDGWVGIQGVALNSSPTQIAAAVIEGVNGQINAYIWRRVFWMLGAVILLLIVFSLWIIPGTHASRAYSSREARRTTRSSGIRHSRSSSRYR